MRALRVLAAAGVVLALAGALWPRPDLAMPAPPEPATLPDDLDAALAAAEAAVPHLRPGAERRILWSGAAGEATDLSIVYLHGFSASAAELRPVPDRIAADLGANLHFARLTGHGRDGPAMAEATAGAWLADTAEAIAIGRRIGGRVLLVGCSTGATLAALAAADPELSEGLAGVVLVSPNFAPANPAARLLTWPLARRWVPWLTGPDRGFEPYNAEHAAHWTTRYPVAALFPMAEIVAAARRADLGVAEVPALFVYSVHDEVVSPGAIKRAATRWGGPVRQELLVPGPEDDPDAHVLGGDILSPGLTEPLVQIVAGWAAEL